jgi:hypothetical protein
MEAQDIFGIFSKANCIAEHLATLVLIGKSCYHNLDINLRVKSVGDFALITSQKV